MICLRWNLTNLVGDLTIHEIRLKEHQRRMSQDPKEDPVALKAKKSKAKIKSISMSDDERNDVRVNLLVIGFNIFFKTKER